MASSTSTNTLPIIDAMISVYGIGPVFADTVLSILNQRQEGFRLRCLVVIDGCPYMDEVQPVLSELMASGEHDLSVIYQKNAGVTHARNRAIEHFLSQEERGEFAFFMDGDDIAPPNFFASALKVLQAERDAPQDGLTPGWAFADQFHFGDQSHWVQYPHHLWGTRFALNNLSQPSSLICMSMLEAGLRFDSSFIHGIEDWDFWCSAVQLGYYGVHVSDTAMRYRRLLGSRSSQNRANDPLTKYRLMKKHTLDKYETLVPETAHYPRRGLLTRADPKVSQSALPHLSLQADAVTKLWSQVSMLGGIDKNIVFGAPHVPEFLEIHPSSKPRAPLADDLFYALQHAFVWQPKLIGLQVNLLDADPILLISPRRFLGYDGTKDRKYGSANLTGKVGFWIGYSDGLPRDLTSENRLAIKHLRALAPKRESGLRQGFEQRRVGDRNANSYTFYNTSLGFLPYAPDRDREAEKTELALVVDRAALADPAAVSRLQAVAAQRAAPEKHLHIVVIHDREDPPTPNMDATLAACEPVAVHHLYAARPLEKMKPGPRYNGAYFDRLDPKWLSYAMGLLSWFDEIVNLGSTRTSFVLAGLRARKRIHTVYAPIETATTTDEYMRLSMLVGTYDEITPASERWRDAAIGLGAPGRAFASSLGEAS